MGIGIYKWILYVALGYFTVLMLMISLQYVPMEWDKAFLRIKQDEVGLGYYRLAFVTHVYTSIFTLLAGFVQFSKKIRQNYTRVHRYSGYFYVMVILVFSAPSGLVMGYHANGGWSSQLAFMLLSILWFVFTLKAFLYAKKRNFVQHKKYMWRSFALTLSAITLRLWKWFLVNTFEPNPMDIYRIVAWLGWVVNLVVVDWMLRKDIGVRGGENESENESESEDVVVSGE